MRARLLLFFALTYPLSGCVSYWKGKEMQADTAAVQAQVDQMVDDQRRVREDLKKQVEGLTDKLTAIEKSLNDAIARLQNTSAGSGLIIERLKGEIASLKGEIETFKHKAAQEKASPIPLKPDEAKGPALADNPADLYRYGYQAKVKSDCKEAIRAFSKLARDFPEYERTDNGLALAADCQYAQKEYNPSLRTLKVIVEKYPKGDKVDDAYILMHDNFLALGQCETALSFLETFIDQFPSSNRMPEARKKLKTTRKKCR